MYFYEYNAHAIAKAMESSACIDMFFDFGYELVSIEIWFKTPYTSQMTEVYFDEFWEGELSIGKLHFKDRYISCKINEKLNALVEAILYSMLHSREIVYALL